MSGESSLSPSYEDLFLDKFQQLNLKYFEIVSSESSVSFSLDIWAKPNSKVERVYIVESGEVVLHIKEKPVEGAANKGLIKVLSELLSVPRNSIELSKGSKSKFKRFSFHFTFTDRKNIDYYLKQLDNLVGK